MKKNDHEFRDEDIIESRDRETRLKEDIILDIQMRISLLTNGFYSASYRCLSFADPGS
jgi:hypothetical protein